MVALHVMLVAITLAGPRSDASPFVGCHAVSSRGVGHGYLCKELKALIEDHSEPVPDDYFDGMMLGLESTLGDGTTRSEERIELARESRIVRTARSRGGRGAVFLAVIARLEGRRLVTCAEVLAGKERCKEVLQWLAERPWRDGPAPGAELRSPPGLMIAGRLVEIPAGCSVVTQTETGGTLECTKPSMATWAFVPDPQAGRVALGQFAEYLKRKNRPGVDLQEDEVPCLLAGAATRCQRLQLTVEGKRQLVLLGQAVVGGRTILGICLGPGGEPLAPPCSIPFALPGVAEQAPRDPKDAN